MPVALLARLLALGAELFEKWLLIRAQHGVDLFNLLVANLAHLLIRLVPDLVEDLPQLPYLVVVQLNTGAHIVDIAAAKIFGRETAAGRSG